MNNFWEIYNLFKVINISNNKEIRIAFVKKGNSIGVDIRNFYKKDNEWRHGKGVLIPQDKWEEFQNSIAQIKK